LGDLVARNRRHSAFRQVDRKAARAGTAPVDGVGLSIENPIVGDVCYQGAALEIVTDQLPAERTIAYRQAACAVDVESVLKIVGIRVSVIPELRVVDGDGLAGIVAGEDAFLVVDKVLFSTTRVAGVPVF
jgi:hypothetical protein